ncbi:MAG TPA: hypothetical protein GXX14_02560 [Clostridiaceae bacterium]|mgnify:CR=1 FL=1|nr:hypothetical protein [Clostridiaceae bacterium]
MAIFVRHKESDKIYVLIGTGYGAYKSATPSFLGGNLFPREEEGEIPVAAVADERGEIQWFYTDELKVIEIDGIEISKVFEKHNKKEPGNLTGHAKEVCPACFTEISEKDTECPSCGLVFQIEDD